MSLTLSTLVYDDMRIIEEQAALLEAEGLTYEAAIEAAVAKIESLTADKALSYARVITNLESTAEAIKEACKRQSARASAKANLADRLKKRMLELLPKDFKAEDAEISIRFQKNPAGVDDSGLTDIKAFRASYAEFVRVVPESLALDKNAVKAALKEGRTIEGIKLTESYSVRIS